MMRRNRGVEMMALMEYFSAGHLTAFRSGGRSAAAA
jgi:hypothetical protein